jgi:radical SAM protein with 4Fe4S-binding SPASM domain
MAFEGFPLVVGWELTLACNLRCGHCASSAGTPRPYELSLDEALDICDQFPSLLVQEVDFTGGEPLLRTDWPKIAGRLRELNIPARMVTNGLLLQENVPLLRDSGIATIGVSLDGLEPTHDRIRRRPGLFRQVIDGVEASLAAGIPTAVITAVNWLNVKELPELLVFLQNLGVRHWQVQPTFALGRVREKGGLELTESAFLELGEFIQSSVATCRANDFTIMPADGVGYFAGLDTREKAWRGCGAGMASCGITSNGKVKGCLSHPDNLIEGDVRERELWDIWFDERSFAYTRQFTLENLGESCEGCQFGEQCKGGCMVMSYAATHRFHNDPFCFYGIQNRRGIKKQ